MIINWTGVKPQGMDNPLKQAAVREAELASIRRELEEVLFLDSFGDDDDEIIKCHLLHFYFMMLQSSNDHHKMISSYGFLNFFNLWFETKKHIWDKKKCKSKATSFLSKFLSKMLVVFCKTFC